MFYPEPAAMGYITAKTAGPISADRQGFSLGTPDFSPSLSLHTAKSLSRKNNQPANNPVSAGHAYRSIYPWLKE